MSENGGERELVLGNRQLLAIFFVGVLLCGVFFAMGYVVGGNSAKTGAATPAGGATDSAPASSAEGKRQEPPPQSPIDSSSAAPPPGSGDTGTAFPGAEPKVSDNPAAAGALPPANIPAAAPTQAAPYAPAKKATAPASPPALAAVPVSEPETGASYWQVIAIGRPTADNLVQSLREKQLPAILAKSSKPELFEVLVGPYRTTYTMAEAKKKLTDLGYGGLIPHKP